MSAFLIENGAGGVVEETAGKRVRLITYGDRAMLERLALAVPGEQGSRAPVRVRAAPASLEGWDTAWMRSLEPVTISRSLTLVPTTSAPPMSERASVVHLGPALAFGFGDHPTTRLAARSVERWCRAGNVKTVLDVGTGSGVLAIVAAVSGATRVVGVDIDAGAVRIAEQNAALNGVARRCRFSRTPVSLLRAHFDLVVANVDRRTILLEAKALRRSVAPGGTLLLTGFLAGDAADVERHFLHLGLMAGRRKREADWALVTLGASQRHRERPATARRTSRKPRSR